ncbi:SIMPL domain-containing protein [Pseudonocardia sp. MH-G8]|uniref:SIMPL domain-containing protein n=1 Tax=Pseudonocardia sp. MH-G8 TaxID=1854588 RepID=UPI000BA04EDD|nr:SIMPL domain-containing protein [Pseudonocardia sp. MH-G8]OZM83015.1 SIMPL domain-containing protein [Pseudonocardia sp. MH-G8]
MTATDEARTPEIVTEGNGWFEQLGDRAEVDVTFTAVARSRSTAVAELGTRMAGAEAALRRPGLDVRHRRLRVHNEWRDGRVVGCRAAEDLALLVTDVSALDDVLSALLGAEPTDLRGPRWVLTDPAAALREAQQRAVSDARTRAEGYATALGGRLGPLRRLSEVAEHSAPMAYRTAAVESGGPDVRALGLEPEPVRVTAKCTTTWVFLS